MKNILLTVQIILSIFLIALIIMQSKGVGLGKAWGGGGEFYKSRRGVERFVFMATIVLSVLFFASCLLNFFVS